MSSIIVPVLSVVILMIIKEINGNAYPIPIVGYEYRTHVVDFLKPHCDILIYFNDYSTYHNCIFNYDIYFRKIVQLIINNCPIERNCRREMHCHNRPCYHDKPCQPKVEECHEKQRQCSEKIDFYVSAISCIIAARSGYRIIDRMICDKKHHSALNCRWCKYFTADLVCRTSGNQKYYCHPVYFAGRKYYEHWI